MKTIPLPVLVRHLQPCLLLALMTLASTVILCADTTGEKTKSSTGPTNAMVIKNAPTSGTTNLAHAIPPLPAPPAVPAFPNLTITTDEDGSSTDIKLPGHSKTLEMDGHEVAETALEALLIPIVAIVATFATPILIVFFVCYFKYRRRRENLTLAQEFLNKGLPVPPQLLDESQGTVDYSTSPNSPNRCKSDLRRGFKLAFIGLGVTLALYASDPHSTTWAWGLIPMVMGIGYLISGWVEGRQLSQLIDPRTTTQIPKNPL